MRDVRNCLCGLAFVAVGACRSSRGEDSPAESGRAVGAVLAAERSAVDAWNRGDLDAHVSIFADTGTGGPPMGPGGRARVRASLAPVFAQGARLEVDSLRAAALGGDYVLASGRWSLRAPSGVRSGWFTHVWARLPAGWRVTYEHSQ
jgi:ketosteroid isomerase-like protein